MEKELDQSDLTSERKVPNTIQKYHIRGKKEKTVAHLDFSIFAIFNPT